MGLCQSRVEKEEAVARCKARRRYMKDYVKARRDFATAHALYLHSLRSTAAALLQFSAAESPTTATASVQRCHQNTLLSAPLPRPPPLSPSTSVSDDRWTTSAAAVQRHHQHIPPPSPPLPPARPLSPSTSVSDDRWTTSSTTSTILPPPPPPPPSSSWDFWVNPFSPSTCSRSVVTDQEEEWEERTTTVSGTTAVTIPTAATASAYTKSSVSDLAVVVVTGGKKDLGEIAKELDDYFLKAAEAGARVSFLLESPTLYPSSSHKMNLSSRVTNYGKSLRPAIWPWGSSCRSGRYAMPGREVVTSVGNVGNGLGIESSFSLSHSSTVDKLYAWEKKLYLEVKNSGRMKLEHERRVSLLRKQQVNGVDYVKVEKNRREIEKLESKLLVASQAIETTSAEIIRLRESELFPQLLELVTGLVGMWRIMYECHQVQTHIVKQLEYLNKPTTNRTSDIHRQTTLQLEQEVECWHSAFCDLIKSQREYIYSISGWLRLSVFPSHHDPLTKIQQNSEIYSLCEEWQLALDRIPDKVASEGIKSFLAMIHAIVIQQSEEHKLKKWSDSIFKELEKRMTVLRSLESKYGPYSVTEDHSNLSGRTLVMEKKLQVEALRTKAEEEKSRYEKCVAVTRAMTLNNLQTGFPNIFQAMTGFSGVCVQAYESVHNHRERRGIGLKQLMP